MDIQYGLAKGGSCLISNIARSLDEDIKLNYIVDRLCERLSNMYQEEKATIWNNYLNEVSKNIDKENTVIDGSSQDKRIVNGYHVCEATVLTKNKKQPMSIYNKIYSCKSKNFISKNIYTLESIKAA